ncbi:hypothetical protein EDB84DRAFT_626072 [Lactarius hengduanensis]|nr:hypothetical protein EDB84DRAFT_626072 [Lactarius hengduanensis]
MLGQLILGLAMVALFHGALKTRDLSSIVRIRAPLLLFSLPIHNATAFPSPSFPIRHIVLESLLALFGIIGACVKVPALKEITWASEMNTRSRKIPLVFTRGAGRARA